MNAASKLDLGSEVAEVRCAVEGVRVMADTLVSESAPDSETVRLMPRRIAALLNLIVARVRLVERALNGSRDPAELLAHHNKALGPDGTHLRPWTTARIQQEVERLVRRDRHERQRRWRGR